MPAVSFIANHAPAVKIEGPLTVLANAGDKVRLNGAGFDPDKNAVTINWW